MPLTPTVIITGNLVTITGAVDAAKAQFDLVGFGATVPRVQGTAVIVQTSTTATADGSGNISVTIWGLDVITPRGCYYTVTFFNDAGGVVASLPYNAFAGSATYDLSQVVPMGQVVVAPQQPNSAIPQIFTPIAHQFLTGMNSLGVLSSAQPAFTDISGVLTGSQLPTPTASTLGGVKSLAPTGGLFVTGIGTDGVPTTASPSFSIPNPSPTTLGGIESFAAQAHKWINAISTLGVPTATQPAAADLSDGTTGSGTIVLANTPTLITPNIGAATGTSLSTTGIIKSQVGGGGTAAGLQVVASSPALLLQNTGATADNKIWDFATSGSTLLFRAINDAQNAFGNYMTVTRSGAAISSVLVGAPLQIGASDTGISRSAAGTIAFGNGTASDSSGTLTATVYAAFSGATQTARCDNTGLSLASNMPLAISSTTSVVGTKDTGISRVSAGVLGIGNGTQGDFSGTVKLTTITGSGSVTVGTAAWAGVLNIAAQDGVNEGGELHLLGAAANTTAIIDTQGGNIRLFGGAASPTTFNLATGGMSLAGLITSYNGTATVGNGVPTVVHALDLTTAALTQSGTINASAPAGMYVIYARGNLVQTVGPSNGTMAFTYAGKTVGSLAVTAGGLGSFTIQNASTFNASDAVVFSDAFFVAGGTNLTYSASITGAGNVANITANVRLLYLG